MVRTSSIIFAATIAFFAVGPSLAFPTERHSISTRENVDNLEVRGWGSLIGKVATTAAKHEVKKKVTQRVKHEVTKEAKNQVNQATQGVFGSLNQATVNRLKSMFSHRNRVSRKNRGPTLDLRSAQPTRASPSSQYDDYPSPEFNPSRAAAPNAARRP